MDVWEYFEQRRDEIAGLSFVLDGVLPFFSQEDGNDQRGRLFGTLQFAGFDGPTFLQVHEVIEVDGTGIHRLKYAYYLFIDGQEVGAYERTRPTAI